MGYQKLRSGIAFLTRVCHLAAPYFRSSEERWRARLLLAAVILLTLVQVLMQVQINGWYQDFYTTLQTKNLPAFLPLVGRFLLLAAIFIIAGVQENYWQQMRWRVWLTHRFVGGWLQDTSYYLLQLEGLPTDNPDQRISEDLDTFTTGSLTLGLGIVQSVITLVSFVVILWDISPSLTIPIGATGTVIPHYMVWVALGYAILGSVLVHYVGRRLIGLNFLQQRYEADFRFNLVRVRENAEAIALYRGEAAEAPRLGELVERIRANWWRIMAYTRRLGFFQSGFAQLEIVFGIFAAAPSYFAGGITQGVLIQIGDAFQQVEGSLSWFITAYDRISAWKATTDRLLTFEATLAALEAVRREPRGPRVRRDGYADIRADDLSLAVPGGHTILEHLSFAIEPGEHVLITGPTGAGKSTLFRAIAGIWPFGDGEIQEPGAEHMMFLPQEPHMPIGTLRAALSYPDPEGVLPDDELRAALEAVGLAGFVERLDEAQHWGMQMSPGEQQKLAVARALLQRPGWLFLDEATSAMDEAGEEQTYEVLTKRLPTTALVSIAHRRTLMRYHDRTIALARNRPSQEAAQ